jgi:hypothetical protein
VAAVVYFYRRDYNFDEKTDAEWALVHKWEARLKETMPEEYKTGCHMVAAEAAFMGDDIWIIGGDIQHNTHCKHAPCGEYAVLHYRGRGSWCGKCDRATTEDEIVRWDADHGVTDP